MSNLVFRNNFPGLFLTLGLFVSIAVSCRKKIDHTPAVSDPTTRWKMITNTGEPITSIEVFNNQLYIAGLKLGTNYKYIPTLKRLNANYDVVGFHNGIFSKVAPNSGGYTEPSINILYATSDKLYIAGNFAFNLNNATSFMSYDLNGNFTAIPMLTQNSCYVSAICPFENDLVVGGYFGTYEPLVHTSNTERIQNNTAVGLNHFPDKVIAFAIHSNQLFAIGQNNAFKKWDGSSWTTVVYNNYDSDDELMGICSFNNELYVSGSFRNQVYLKKLNLSGVWEDLDEVSYASNANLKVIDNTLYLFGNGIYLNGKYLSEILSYDGSKWEPVGSIKSGVYINNLVKFNNKLICSTGNRLYAFE